MSVYVLTTLNHFFDKKEVIVTSYDSNRLKSKWRMKCGGIKDGEKTKDGLLDNKISESELLTRST